MSVKPGQAHTGRLEDLTERRRKLLELHYQEQITAEFFGSEEAALSQQMEALRSQVELDEQTSVEHDEIAQRFEQVLAVLAELDLDEAG